MVKPYLVAALAFLVNGAACKRSQTSKLADADEAQDGNAGDEPIKAALEVFKSGEFAPAFKGTVPSPTPADQLFEGLNPYYSSESTTSTGMALTELPEQVQLNKWLGRAQNQGEEGACTAFGLVGAMELWLRKNNAAFEPSEAHFWSLYHASNMEKAIQTAQTNFVSSRRDWPWTGERTTPAPSDDQPMVGTARLKRIAINDIHAAIARGNPVYFAFMMSEEAGAFGKDGWIKLPKQVDPFSGHAVFAWGSTLFKEPINGSRGYLALRNSWGAERGVEGSMWMPYEYCDLPNSSCMAYELFGVSRRSDFEPDVDGKLNPRRLAFEMEKIEDTQQAFYQKRLLARAAVAGGGAAIASGALRGAKLVCEQYDYGPPGWYTKNRQEFCLIRELGVSQTDNYLYTLNGPCSQQWCTNPESAGEPFAKTTL